MIWIGWIFCMVIPLWFIFAGCITLGYCDIGGAATWKEYVWGLLLLIGGICGLITAWTYKPFTIGLL